MLSSAPGSRKVDFEGSVWWEVIINAPPGYCEWGRDEKKLFYKNVADTCKSYMGTFLTGTPDGTLLTLSFKKKSDAVLFKLMHSDD